MRIFFSALSTLALLALPVLGGEQLLPQEPRVSDRLQAVMRLDHEFSLALQANSSAAAQLGMAPKSLKMPTSYNEQVADKLFLLSATAYCTDNDNLRDWTCNSCGQFGEFTVTKIMDDTANQGYVGYFTGGLPGPPVPGTPVAANEPFVVVGFRGTVTSDLKDWIEDLSFAKQTPWSANNPNVHVHEGFFQAYMDLRPAMLDGLDKAFSASGARTLLGVGHSLGAAMAELAALDLKLNYYPNKYYATYTQGTPRPGDQGFADLYNSAIDASFREIHQADLVPHLPPMLLGFKHGPTEVWFNEDWNSYKVCSGSNGEDGSCSDSVVLPVSINDHTHYRGVEVAGLCSNNAKMLNIKPLPTPNQSGAAKPQQQQQPQEEAVKQQHKKVPHILTE